MTREQFAESIHWPKIILLVGFLNPLFMVPQLTRIWEFGSVEGVSILTLVILLFIQVGFASHGFFLRDRPLMHSNFAAATVTLATAASTIYFRLL